MPLSRDEAHRLVDELDAVDVGTAVALLRQLVGPSPARSLRTVDLVDGPEDLAERSADILRAGLGRAADDEPSVDSRDRRRPDPRAAE